MAHFNLDLDLDKSQSVGQVVRARVGDVESCVISATIYDHGSEVDLAGMGARFCVLKPDRTVVEDDDCEVSGSTVTHTLGTQATSAAGVAKLAYFEILDGSTVIDSTQCFRLVVEPSAEGSGTGPSEDYISRVDAATEAANDAADAANEAAQRADAAAERAEKLSEDIPVYVTASQQAAVAAASAASEAEGSAGSASASASAASGSASAAAGSAGQAASSAAAAAESAAQVDGKYITSATATTLDPGSQATASVSDQVLTIGVPRGDKGDPGDVSAVHAAEGSDLSVSTDEGTVTIDDSALRARIEDLENASRNVITGTSTDLVSHADDAYAQKPRETRIKGKTWVNRWPAINGDAGGFTAETDETGLITVSGTGIVEYTQLFSADALGVSAGKQYTIALSSKPLNVSVSLIYDGAEGTKGDAIFIGTSENTTSKTGSVPAGATNFRCRIGFAPGATVNASFRVMLVDGTESPDCFTPPASITSAQPENLVTAGKNLLKLLDDLPIKTSGGVTFTPQPDGGILVNGTNSSGSNVFYNLDFITGATSAITDCYALVGRTVAKSGGTGSVSFVVGVFFTDGTFASIMQSGSTSAIIPNNAKKLRSYLYVSTGTTVNNEVIYPQLELGSTATAYEPPSVTQTPLPEVELRSLPNGTCDELVIKADGTCELERRTGYIASYADEEVNGEYVSTGNGLEAGASIVYELDEPTIEPQTSVTPPTLPAPTFNQYHDSPVPSDTSTEYVRDINIAFSELQAQVSATTVREATNG